MVKLVIVQIPASSMDNFSYLVYCPQTREGAAVDPSQKPELLLRKAEELGVTIRYLLNTHGHQDHTAGNRQILQHTDARLAAHPLDVVETDIPLQDGDRLEIGEGALTVLHTPGHTPGSVVFRDEDAIITGDTLFVSRCGRADLPGSDVRQLYASLQRLRELPAHTVVYPGHDYGPTPTSTLEWELKNNDFLNSPDLESFIELRMG